MRTLTSLATLAALVSTSAIAVRPADACGGYMPDPKVLLLSTHRTEGGTRTFALMSEDSTKVDGGFVALAPESFDRTAVADVAESTSPVALTLVGRSGTRAVTSAKRVLVAHTLEARDAVMSALDVSSSGVLAKGEFQIAVVGGRFRALAWSDLAGHQAATTADAAWLKQHGEGKLSTIYTQPVSKTFDVLLAYDADARRYVSIFRTDGAEVVRWSGAPIGLLVADGRTFVVVDDHGLTRTEEIY